MNNKEQYTCVVLLTKDMKYFDTIKYDMFLDFLDFLSDNDVHCHIDTVYIYTEVWFASCGKKQLHKLFIEFINKGIDYDE